MKIFVYEMKKILIKQYAIIILAAVVIVRLLSSLPLAKQTYGFDSATEREKYFEIISPFIGVVTEEKTDRADELENQLETASQQYDKLIDQRLEHKISDIEYYEQMKLYEPTLNIKKQIEKTVEQVRPTHHILWGYSLQAEYRIGVLAPAVPVRQFFQSVF